MRLLLPPSESKRPGGRGRPLAARGLAGPLAGTRSLLLDALQRLLAGDPAAAAAALQLPPGVARDALAANAAVTSAPTMPALRRYTGVVYDALGYPSLPPAARRIADRSVLIFSGLWGVLRGDDPVPDYRVPAKASLPGIGIAGSAWRPVLATALPAILDDGLVVDLRSSDYAAMWRPPRGADSDVVTVRVLSPLPCGGHGVVSFPSKHGKGRLARALLEAAAHGAPPATIDDVAAAWLASGGRDAERPHHGHLDLRA